MFSPVRQLTKVQALHKSLFVLAREDNPFESDSYRPVDVETALIKAVLDRLPYEHLGLSQTCASQRVRHVARRQDAGAVLQESPRRHGAYDTRSLRQRKGKWRIVVARMQLRQQAVQGH